MVEFVTEGPDLNPRVHYCATLTPTTVYAMGLTQPELKQVSHACDITFTTQTLETIKTHTVFQTLQASISRGWPENKQHIGQSLQPFCTYKEELTIDKGLIFTEQGTEFISSCSTCNSVQ